MSELDVSKKPDSSAVAAAYQVTARLLSAEQQAIWSRTQGFFALHGLAAALITKGPKHLQAVLGGSRLCCLDRMVVLASAFVALPGLLRGDASQT
jgi:hypothetical protein